MVYTVVKWNDETNASFIENLGLEHVGQTVEEITNMYVIRGNCKLYCGWI